MNKTQPAYAIFDPVWYSTRYPDVADPDAAAAHYHAAGEAEDRSPCVLFDPAWYRRTVGVERLGGLSPVDHYLRVGWHLGNEPHPLFCGRWYLARNPDVAAAGIPPLLHYTARGAQEGRSPHPLFDPKHYGEQVPGVPEAELVSHFLLKGGLAGLDPHPLFSSDWYLATYPDVAKTPVNPLLHYVLAGASEGRDPSPQFDTLAYFARHPQLLRLGGNPLAHFVMARNGIPDAETENASSDQEPEDPAPQIARTTASERAAPRPRIDPAQRRRTRLIAFYLPQFHPIPENDRFWGKGFTEWTNVTRVKPLFPGHRQPLLPSELGFYDLRLDSVRRQQVELARTHGIHGFCYYVYWFDGHRLLEQPLDRHLADKTLDFPFCICWANENWTRRWDGLESEILVGQNHSPRTDRRFIEDMRPYLSDPRYIRVDGKPLVIIYRPELLHDPRMTAAIFRDVCRREGIGEIHLAFVHFHCDRAPGDIGFDSVVEFPPHHFPAPDITQRVVPSDARFDGQVKDYRAGVSRVTAGYKAAAHRRFRGVMPMWDNTARRQSRATVFHGSTPDWYEAWLTAAINCPQPQGSGSDNLVFINAWNEWAEGAVLEPSQEFGRAYLEATRRVMLTAVAEEPPKSRPQGIRWSEKHEPLSRAPRERWLIIGHDAARAGSQILLLGLIRELRLRHGIETHLLLLSGGELLADYEAATPTAVLKQLDVASMRAAALDSLEQEARRLQADLVLVNTVVSAKAGQYLARAGFRTVGMVHELVTSIQSRYGADDFRNMVENLGKVLVVSDFARLNLNEAFSAKLGPEAIVRPGVPIPAESERERSARAARFRRQTGVPAGIPIILGCGHLHPRKGPDIFVALASKVLALPYGPRRPRFVWAGAGDPAYESWCRHDAEALGVASDVLLLGQMSDPADAFAAASVFALTSREDPFPLVNLEAMAWRLPVVGFARAGGAPEALADGAGVVVPYLDAEAMAETIAGWLREPSTADRFAATACERAARLYSIEAFAERVLGAVRPQPAAAELDALAT